MKAFVPTQETIEALASERRTRNVNYVSTKSKDGTFSPRVNAEVAGKLHDFCASRNLNKTAFVEQAIVEKINRELRKELETMSEEHKTELLSHLLGID